MKVLGTLLLLISMVVHSSASSIKVECDGEKWVQEWTSDCSSFYEPVVFTMDTCHAHAQNSAWKEKWTKTGDLYFQTIFKTSADCSGTADETHNFTAGVCQDDLYGGFGMGYKISKKKVVTYSSSSKEDCSNPTTKVFFDSTDCQNNGKNKFTCSADLTTFTWGQWKGNNCGGTAAMEVKDKEAGKCTKTSVDTLKSSESGGASLKPVTLMGLISALLAASLSVSL